MTTSVAGRTSAGSSTAKSLTHATAFRRLAFRSDSTPTIEAIWNSRDGFAPLTLTMRDGSIGRRVFYQAVNPAAEPFVPDYRPQVGERVIVDMTAARAIELAATAAELYFFDASPIGDFTRERFGSQEALQLHLQDLHLDAVRFGGCPDIVEVSEELARMHGWTG